MSIPIVDINPFINLTGFTADGTLSVSGGAVVVANASSGTAVYNIPDTSAGREIARAVFRCDSKSSDTVSALQVRRSDDGTNLYSINLRWLLDPAA